MKNYLSKHQSIAYKMLSNDLKKGDVFTTYLFEGPTESHKLDAAILFCQSLVCENKKGGWACGKCDTCKRVKDNEYVDIKVIDGAKESIKKESIVDLQEHFTKTAFEKDGHKAYIINEVDNMTIASMNSILKFIEEPNQEITAILTTSNKDRLLPTIISRCKVVPFFKAGIKELEENAIKEDINKLDAHILVSNVENIDQIKETSENENYQIALEVFLTFIDKCLEDVDSGIYYLENEGFNIKDRTNLKEVFNWFLKIGLVFVEDSIKAEKIEDARWIKGLNTFKQTSLTNEKFMMVLLSCKDELLINANVALLIDKFGYLLKED